MNDGLAFVDLTTELRRVIYVPRNSELLKEDKRSTNLLLAIEKPRYCVMSAC